MRGDEGYSIDVLLVAGIEGITSSIHVLFNSENR